MPQAIGHLTCRVLDVLVVACVRFSSLHISMVTRQVRRAINPRPSGQTDLDSLSGQRGQASCDSLPKGLGQLEGRGKKQPGDRMQTGT